MSGIDGPGRDVEFFYDVVCPYAYLASAQVEAAAARQGARVRWRPILLGGLLRTVGAPDDPNLVMSPVKARVSRHDRLRFAERVGVPLREPPGHPQRTVGAMRLCLAAQPGPSRVALSHDLFAAYWARGDDLTDERVLAEVATRHGLAADAHRDPSLRDGLRQATAQAAAHGAFGVPSFVVDGHLWWGQDRLPLVERALGDRPVPEPEPTGSTTTAAPTRLRFFHDFSSPFSYLAAVQIEAIAAAYGVQVEWMPILLGALFREIGTPNVPLLAMNETKQAYVRRDLDDWAHWWGTPFRFPAHFPMRSVLPLRVALVEPALTLPIYRAAWAEDRAVDTPEGLGAVIAEAGFDPSLLQRAIEPDNKAALRRTTERAQDLGICGVPTMVIERAGRRVVLWGQDRLQNMLVPILSGWWPQTDEPAD